MSNELPARESDSQAAPSTPEPTEWQYPLDLTCAITVERAPEGAGSGFVARPEHIFAAATPAWGLSQNDLAAARTLVHARAAARQRPDSQTTGPENEPDPDHPVPPDPVPASEQDPPGHEDDLDDEGIAEAFVDLLRHEVIPRVPGFRVVRLVPPPEARGERPITDGDANSVVVGERVVVTWVRDVIDADHEAPRTLTHLDAVEHLEVPETHGMLLWTAPSGREIPIAWATKYLPRARDGWDWCVDLTQRALGVVPPGPPARPDPWVADFPARLGRTAAKLHLALATASSVIPEPTAPAPPDLIRAWHSAARERVEAAADIARAGELEGVADVFLPRLGALSAVVDSLETVAAEVEAGGPPVLVQRVHGDLHVGQILRWPGGLVVVDFHPNPVVEVRGLSVGQPMQPAARDIARLLRSLDHVARVVDKGTGFTLTDAVDAWSQTARLQLIEAYRSELESAERTDLLDERLIAPFEAEQLCREIVYAGEYLPSWVYAPLGGLWQSFEAGTPADDETSPARGRRGRRARAADTL